MSILLALRCGRDSVSIMARVETNGVELAVERWGDGPSVLLVAGIGAAGAMWTPQLPALMEAGFGPITFNNRGIPPSDVPEPPYSINQMATDTAGLIEGLDVAPLPVVGFSLGALITQELALARPDLVSSAVLVGSLGRKDLVRRHLAQHAALVVTEPEPRLPSPVERALQLFGPATLANDEWIAAFLEADAAAAEILPGLIGQQLASSGYDDRLDALNEVTVRCLILSFELDVLVPAALGYELATAIPHSQYHCIQGCGHGGLWERSAEANAAIIGFLRRNDTTP